MSKDKIDKKKYDTLISSIKNFSINLKKLELIKNSEQPLASYAVHFRFYNEPVKQNNPRLLSAYCNYHILCLQDTQKIIARNFDKVVEEIRGSECPYFEIMFTYLVKYEISGKENIDEELIGFFVNKNIPLNVHPYARELISSLTAKMGENTLIIPPLIIK